MKKIFAGGLLAICVIAMSEQQASAWVNSKFGIGLNWNYSAGGNSFGWGLIRNGQIPAPDNFGGMPYGAPNYGPGSQQPFMVPAPTQAIAPVTEGFVPQGAYMMPNVNAPFAGAYYGSPYQFANYPRPSYYFPNTEYNGR